MEVPRPPSSFRTSPSIISRGETTVTEVNIHHSTTKNSGANAVPPLGGFHSEPSTSRTHQSSTRLNGTDPRRRSPRVASFESSTGGSSGAITLASSAEQMVGTPPFQRRLPPPTSSGTLPSPSPSNIYGSFRAPLLSQDSGANSSQSERDIPRRMIQESAPSTSLDFSSGKKKKLPCDKAYFIAKELLMTERTYLKDLVIICQHFRDAVYRLEHFPTKLLDELFTALQPIADFHRGFQMEIENKVTAWENAAAEKDFSASSTAIDEQNEHRLGDVLLCAVHNTLGHYQQYISHLAIFMANIDELFRTKKPFESLYKDFETKKICYLPLNQLLLKPSHRLSIWQHLLTRLISDYMERGAVHPDISDSKVALERISHVVAATKSQVESLENFAKLVELERDLNGVDNLVLPSRSFVREGSLQRFSRKGPVQRLFLLFNDCLLYANRSGNTQTSAQHISFKLHGQIPLRGLMLEDGDPFRVAVGLQNCFTIYGGNRSLIVAASSAEEKILWMEELNKAVATAKESSADLSQFSSLKSTNSADEDLNNRGSFDTIRECSEEAGSPGPAGNRSPSLDRQVHHRANNTLHVCWHRCTTLGASDLHKAGRNQLSGYLLRKFKNSTGWQKLWVVYAQFCLFFYKNHQEEAPLASLPLLGYQAGSPSFEDGIQKDFVFKLHYKTHYYFFRAESDYTYSRWLEVIRSACTVKSGGTNILLKGVPVVPE